MRRSIQGNALMEYMLPAALVLIVCIISMQAAGGNLKEFFSALKSDMGRTSEAAKLASNQQIAMKTEVKFQAPAVSNPNIPSKFCYSNGQCVEMTQELDMRATIETVGANGTITILADKLRQLAADLQAKNEITSEQVGVFNALANQGYRIGEINGLIEKAAKACGSDVNCFNSQKAPFEGGQKSMQELAALIGYRPLSDDPADTENNPEVDAMWNIYKSLPNSVWNNPELKDTVTTLTTQIGQTSNLVMWGTSNIQNGYIGPDGLQQYLVQEAKGTIPKSGLAQGGSAESSTSQDATTICTSGNGTSNGSACR
jgi:Flp pilus assembly pilin Flp